MTYIDQARAGDWGHDRCRQAVQHDGPCVCETCKQPVLYGDAPTCPAKIARFADTKAHEKAIEEIERLAKERCAFCRSDDGPVMAETPGGRSRHYYHPKQQHWCQAQPEQRRLVQLREELAALKAMEGKDANVS